MSNVIAGSIAILILVGTVLTMLFIPWFIAVSVRFYWMLLQKIVFNRVLDYKHDKLTHDTYMLDASLSMFAKQMHTCTSSHQFTELLATILNENMGIDAYIRLLTVNDRIAIGMAFVMAMCSGNTLVAYLNTRNNYHILSATLRKLLQTCHNLGG